MNTENLGDAMMLLAVGMTTVFMVLALVITVGNLLVSFVNKYCPEEEKPKAAAKAQAQTVASVGGDIAMVINAAIEQKFGGKAKVEKIEKI